MSKFLFFICIFLYLPSGFTQTYTYQNGDVEIVIKKPVSSHLKQVHSLRFEDTFAEKFFQSFDKFLRSSGVISIDEYLEMKSSGSYELELSTIEGYLIGTFKCTKSKSQASLQIVSCQFFRSKGRYAFNFSYGADEESLGKGSFQDLYTKDSGTLYIENTTTVQLFKEAGFCNKVYQILDSLFHGGLRYICQAVF